MSAYTPNAVVEVTDMPSVYGYKVSELVWWHTFATDYAVESKTGVSGRPHRAVTGDIEGHMIPKAVDCSFLTGLNTGRVFDKITGGTAFVDDWVYTPYGKHGLLFEDSSSGKVFDARDHVVNGAGIQHAVVVIRLGPPPAGDFAAQVPGNTYAYLELAYGQTSNYRIAFEYGTPIRVDYQNTIQLGPGWYPYAIAESLGNVETYLAHNDNTIIIGIKPDQGRGIITFEIGNGHWIRHSPDRPVSVGNPNASPVLPAAEQYRFYGRDRWASLNVFPARYQPISITKSPKSHPPILNISAAALIGGILGATDPNQTISGNVSQDSQGNLQWNLTAAMPDAGDGLGSATPPKVSDVLCFIPPVYEYAPFGSPFIEAYPQTILVHEVNKWNDALRLGSTTGEVYLNNRNGQYDGAEGNFALNIIGSTNGINAQQRVRGVMGLESGMAFVRRDPARYIVAPFSDRLYPMKRKLCQELIFDGFDIESAVYALCVLGNVAPPFMQFIHFNGFPPYSDSFVGTILPKGMGLNPKLRFLPEQTCIGSLLELLQDRGKVDLFTGKSTPYYFYFDAYGFPHLIAWNPGQQFVKKSYSTLDNTINTELVINPSIEQLRTRIVVQGQDTYTYELLQANRELVWNRGIIGFDDPALERNSRYSSQESVEDTANLLEKICSLGVNVARFGTPFDPTVFAGDLIYVPEAGGLMTVMEIDSVYGKANPADTRSGDYVCQSTILCRGLIGSLIL